MTPQKLKNSILQLAIQGKLVEQRPDEGTAEELYKQIQAEKQALIKAGKIKKEKPLPEITEDEIPFEIPENWKWVRYSDLFDIGSAIRIHQTDWKTEGIPFFRGRELVRLAKTGNPDAEIFISRELYELNKEKGGVPQKGDLLVTAVGTLGKVYIVKGTQPFYYKDAYILRYNNFFKLFSDYFKYVIEAPFIQEYISQGSMGTTVAQLTIEKAKRMLCPLPPLAEQKRIVAKIEELLPLIDRYETAWSRLEDFNKRFPGDMQKSILQMAIQGKLVEQRPEEASINISKLKPKATDEYEFDLPEKWVISHLESISTPIPTKQYQVLESEVKKDGAFAVISQSKEYSIGFTDERSKVFCHAVPVVVFGDHTTEVKYVDFDFVVGADGLKVFMPQTDYVFPEFLYYVFQFNCIGINKIGGYSRHYKYIKDKPIPLPPLEEQKRIVARLEELLPLCERLK